MGNKTLVIWYENGTTSYFENVTDFVKDDVEGEIRFKYFGISSQKKRTATFSLYNIAGHALEI